MLLEEVIRNRGEGDMGAENFFEIPRLFVVFMGPEGV